MAILKYFVEQIANPVLRKMGDGIVSNHRANSLTIALRRLAKRYLQIQTTIDVGALNGKWSRILGGTVYE